jgi:hypothetical protein
VVEHLPGFDPQHGKNKTTKKQLLPPTTTNNKIKTMKKIKPPKPKDHG